MGSGQDPHPPTAIKALRNAGGNLTFDNCRSNSCAFPLFARVLNSLAAQIKVKKSKLNRLAVRALN